MDLNSSKDRNYGEHFKNPIFTSPSCVHSYRGPTKQLYNSGGSDHGEIRKLKKGSVAQVRVRGVKEGTGAVQAPRAIQIANLRKGFPPWQREALPSYVAIKSFIVI